MIPDLNEKFINNLSNQLSSMFATNDDELPKGLDV